MGSETSIFQSVTRQISGLRDRNKAKKQNTVPRLGGRVRSAWIADGAARAILAFERYLSSGGAASAGTTHNWLPVDLGLTPRDSPDGCGDCGGCERPSNHGHLLLRCELGRLFLHRSLLGFRCGIEVGSKRRRRGLLPFCVLSNRPK